VATTPHPLFAIFDENDQQGIVKQVMKRMAWTPSSSPPARPRPISWPKTTWSIRRILPGLQRPQQRARRPHLPGLQGRAAQKQRLDFDDLLLEACALLKVAGDVRERYQRRYRYLLVDDTRHQRPSTS